MVTRIRGEHDVVAIKVLNPRPDLLEPTRIGNVRQRFRREVKNGYKLHHPYIVEHLDHGKFVTITRVEDNVEYRFISERARKATAKWGVKSVSILAHKP